MLNPERKEGLESTLRSFIGEPKQQQYTPSEEEVSAWRSLGQITHGVPNPSSAMGSVDLPDERKARLTQAITGK
jgi:hypothetical protein